MPKLVIIRGNSGCGKSTTSKRLRYALGYETMLVSQDVIRRDILRVKDTSGNPSIQLIKDTVIYGLGLGFDVIVEGILHRDKYGQMLRELATLFDETYVYYFDISFEETLRRHQTKPNAHEFGETLMREWYVASDVLNLPSEKLITEDQSQDEILQVILNDVQ
jgi:predicted ABC-type ATPase